jgi:hypothetical protein
MKRDFQMFELTVETMIIRQQRYHDVIWKHAIGLLANYEQSVGVDEDVAWLHEHIHSVNPPAASFLSNRKHTSGHPAVN